MMIDPKNLTEKNLQALLQCSDLNAASHRQHIRSALHLYDLLTPLRICAVMAQAGTETLGLRYMREIWGPTEAQKRYEPGFDLGKTLGNTQIGDGYLFRGRGPIMLTGRANYIGARDRLRKRFPSMQVPDFERQPDLAGLPQWGWIIFCDFFVTHGCVGPTDVGDNDRVSRIINGGTNGRADRRARYANCRKLFGLAV